MVADNWTVRLAVALRCLRLWTVGVLVLTVGGAPAAAAGNVGFSKLFYVCPSPDEIDFSWAPASNASFYSLQLLGPIDPTVNGGVTGTYLRQFGSIEVAKGQTQNAAITLAPAVISSPLTMQWQVMVGGPNGYTGLIPTFQTAIVTIPCTQNTLLASV